MDKEEFLHILEKYRQGRATEDEQAFLLEYYALFEHRNEVTNWKEQDQFRQLREKIKAEIDLRADIAMEIGAGNAKQKTLHRYTAWLVAATVLIISTFYFFENRKSIPVQQVAQKVPIRKDLIVPGSNQATLTLGNGEVVRLDDQQTGLIRQHDGVKVQKAEKGHLVYNAAGISANVMHTVSTPRGGQYQLTFSDGTRVWLNAATSIRFPAVFADSARRVELSGEAYFEVAHDAKRPFEVCSAGQAVRVLGTRFNVTAYADEPSMRTTLLEGKVNVLKMDAINQENVGEGRILKPGQQSSLTGGRMQVTTVDPETSVAWKNGYFRFDKADIRSVMRQISRWYDVEVEYRGQGGGDLFAGEIKRDEDISNVLRIIQLNHVDAKLTGRKIIVTQ